MDLHKDPSSAKIPSRKPNMKTLRSGILLLTLSSAGVIARAAEVALALSPFIKWSCFLGLLLLTLVLWRVLS